MTGDPAQDLLLVTAVPGVPFVLSLVLWRLRRRWWPLVVAVAGLAAALITAVVLIERDYRDADGFVDCWPSCSTLQDGVGLAFMYGGALLVLAGLISLVALSVLALKGELAREWR